MKKLILIFILLASAQCKSFSCDEILGKEDVFHYRRAILQLPEREYSVNELNALFNENSALIQTMLTIAASTEMFDLLNKMPPPGEQLPLTVQIIDFLIKLKTAVNSLDSSKLAGSHNAGVVSVINTMEKRAAAGKRVFYTIQEVEILSKFKTFISLSRELWNGYWIDGN